MKKVLRVIEPFFTADAGDTFVFNESTKLYSSVRNEEFHKAGDENQLDSSYTSTFNISADYAKDLIKEGYLEEVNESSASTFVNIFDEINNLIEKYTTELNNVDSDLKDAPQCLKVEKTTVLSNIIKVLEHLKKLKK